MLLGVVVGWLLASAFVVLGARGHLADAERDLGMAERAVRRLEVDVALDATRAADADLVRAEEAFARPLLAPWRIVPVAARNLRVVRAITTEARSLTSEGGVLLTRAQELVDLATDRRPGDPLPVAEVGALGAPFVELAETAEDAAAEVAALDSGALLPPVRDAFDAFVDRAVVTAEQTRTAGAAASLTATLLGGDEPQRYFVGAATPAELRGTGGLIGAWSIMEVDAGEFSFDPFTRILDLVFESVEDADAAIAADDGEADDADDDDPGDSSTEEPSEDATDEDGEQDGDTASIVDRGVTPPTSDYLDRYGAYDALRDWRNTTMTPDFPSAAVVMERLWRRSRPEVPIDGVLVIDPFAFQALASGTDGLQLSSGITVPSDEIVDFVTNGAYEAIGDDAERREAIGEVATAALRRLVDQLDRGNLAQTLKDVGGLFTSGHAVVHSVDPTVQERIVELGVSGGLVDAPGDELGLALNNGAGNKVDYWLTQRWDVRVAPLADGDTSTTMTVTLRNGAPTQGFSQEVLGPFVDSLSPGDTILLTTALCGPTCGFVVAPDEDEATTDREQGFGLNDEWVRLEAGESTELTWSFLQEGSWSLVGGVYRHELQVYVPPTVQTPEVTIDVRVPASVVPVGLPDTAQLVGDGVRWQPGPGISRLVITDDPGRRAPSLGDALRRPASSLF